MTAKFEDIYNAYTKSKSDEYYTPLLALKPLFRYISKDKIIWECTDTSGNITSAFRENGYDVVSTSDNFLEHKAALGDIIVTNPPYSLKTEFLEHCYDLNVPFALLLPLTALEGKRRQELYREYGIKLILFNRRIQFMGGKNNVWFATAWFTHGINLPKELNFHLI